MKSGRWCPYPDHSDFLRDFSASAASLHLRPELTMETSRGCWWGQKHHCTFCGLNGKGMRYRSKSSTRAFDEIVHLVGAYGMFALAIAIELIGVRMRLRKARARLRDGAAQ